MENKTKECGYLGIYVGPMYSGKTSKLLELYKQYTFCKISTAVINYSEDTRYTDESMLSTHDKVMVPCHLTTSLYEAFPINLEEMNKYEIYLINEGQFYSDIVEWVKEVISPPYNKTVYICGLDGDFKRKVFENNWLHLIAYSDTVEKLTAICTKCKNAKAIFSQRLTKEMEQKVIGSDCYTPLCRKCYI